MINLSNSQHVKACKSNFCRAHLLKNAVWSVLATTYELDKRVSKCFKLLSPVTAVPAVRACVSKFE